MALTMHSHSGQFCPGHARDELEAIVRHAASLGYGTMALTEHMPRLSRADLYPEELADPLDPSRPADAVAAESLAGMGARHAEFLAEALRLRELFHPRPGGAREEEMEEGKEGRPQKAVLHVLIGFEGEWIRAADYGPYIRTLAAHPAVDFWIGSLHHVRGVPIDFDRAAYEAAIAACEEDGGGVAVYEDEDTDTDDAASALTNGNGHVNGASKRRTTRLHGEQALFAAYYDEQHGLLTEMEPRVVGHFDLIRLLARDGDAADVKRNWPAVWRRVLRNLAAAAKYGGWLECNSSALRKGLAEPYPGRDIAEVSWAGLLSKFRWVLLLKM